MWKFVLGPILMGVGYVVGSIYGASAQQRVHARPAVVYDALHEIAASNAAAGIFQLEGGAAIPYELKVDATADERMNVRMMMGGRQAVAADVVLTPQADGAETLITVKMHADHAVLRKALAGTSKAKLAYAPDWLLNLTAKPQLKRIAYDIEHKGEAQASTDGDPQAGWTDEQRAWADEREQERASQPMVDPDAAAKAYMGQTN